MSTFPLDSAICPLCGQANACAAEVERATGEVQPPCWCMSSRIPPDVLARVPDESRGLACVCQRCAANVPAAAEAQK